MLSLLRRRRPARQTPAQILERLEALRTAHHAPRIEARGAGAALSFASLRQPVVLRPDARGDDPDALALRQAPATEEIRQALAHRPHLLAWSAPGAGAWIDIATAEGGLLAWGGELIVGRLFADPEAAPIPEGTHRLVVGPLSAHQRLALADPVSVADRLPSLLAYLPGRLPEDPAGACVRAGPLLAVAIGRDPTNLFLLPPFRIP